MKLEDFIPDNSIAVEYQETEDDILVSLVLATGVDVLESQFAIGDKVSFYQADASKLKSKAAMIVPVSKSSHPLVSGSYRKIRAKSRKSTNEL